MAGPLSALRFALWTDSRFGPLAGGWANRLQRTLEPRYTGSMVDPDLHVLLVMPHAPSRELVLSQGEAVLAGRNPDLACLAGRSGLPPVHRAEMVDGLGVSANHLLIWATEQGIQLLDLGSRNGTWVKLSPGIPTTVAGTSQWTVQLAARPSARAAEHLPADAKWTEAEEFPIAVAQAVRSWLADVGEHVETVVARDTGAKGNSPNLIPLPRGLMLHLRPQRTVNAGWTDLLATVWRYVEEQSRILQAEESSRDEGMVLASESARRAYRQVVEAALRGKRLMLLGPSGAGKEGLALAYHRHSGRPGPFVALNCGEVSRELFRAELFGSEEGAFTSSVRRIPGVVEQANGGTLFLDEIGEMPPEVQPMLLRFLDQGDYTTIGRYGRPHRADVRIVCAANGDLRNDARAGKFRQDLWFRLSIAVVEIPGLSERFEDVVAYLKTRQVDGASSALAALSPAALEVLRNHEWHGSFRELANFVDRLPARVRNGSIDEQSCRALLQEGAVVPIRAGDRPAAEEPGDPTSWATWSEAALRAFMADHAGRAPGSWEAVQSYVEKYLKPLVLVGLGGGAGAISRDPVALQKTARRLGEAVQADRGTAVKHLARFFERFGDTDDS